MLFTCMAGVQGASLILLGLFYLLTLSYLNLFSSVLLYSILLVLYSVLCSFYCTRSLASRSQSTVNILLSLDSALHDKPFGNGLVLLPLNLRLTPQAIQSTKATSTQNPFLYYQRIINVNTHHIMKGRYPW